MSVPTDAQDYTGETASPAPIAPVAVQDVLPPVDDFAAKNAAHLLRRAAEQKAAGDRARAKRGESPPAYQGTPRRAVIMDECACGRRPNVAGYSKDGRTCGYCERGQHEANCPCLKG